MFSERNRVNINLEYNNMAVWNPWRGCKKRSEGCLHCYIHKGDAKRNVDTSKIIRTKDFEKRKLGRVLVLGVLTVPDIIC